MAKPHFRTIRIITILAIFLSQFSQVGIMSVTPVAAAANTFTVNSTADVADADPGDGLSATILAKYTFRTDGRRA